MNIHSKRCTKCAACKPVAEFHTSSRTTDGLEFRCKACRSIAKPGTVLPLPWSDAEDGILRAFYPAGGAKACIVLLDRRAIQSIQQRARRIGVSFQRFGSDGAKKDTPAQIAPASPLPFQDSAELHRAWQQIDRQIAAIPAANGPSYFSMGVAA